MLHECTQYIQPKFTRILDMKSTCTPVKRLGDATKLNEAFVDESRRPQ